MNKEQCKAFAVFCKYNVAKQEYEKGNTDKALELLIDIKGDGE